MEFIKKNYKYLIIFLFFLFLYVVFFYENCSFDVLWNYSFSHAIRIGEVPYRDFNIISTPLYNFIMSIGLFIKDDIFVYLIEQSLLVTGMFYVLNKMFGNKCYLLLPVLSCPLFYQFNGTYNFFCFFLIILLIYLEKNKKSDLLIGFCMGLLILSKQTIGLPVVFFVLLGNLINKKKIKDILIRIGGLLIPCFIFLIYLLLTGSFMSFIDLCFLGLFDFSSSNHASFNFFVITGICLFLFNLYLIFKDKKNINYYYLLGSFFFCVPLFDFYHIGLYSGILCVVLLDKIKLEGNFIRNLSFCLFFLICGFNILLMPNKFSDITVLGEKHYSLYVLKKSDKKWISNVIDKYKEYDDAIMLDEVSMFYDVVSDKEITYFNVLLKGNFGYDGINKMIKKIDKMDKQVFFIDRNKYKVVGDKNQLATDIIKYVIKNSKKIDSVENYDIYYKE